MTALANLLFAHVDAGTVFTREVTAPLAEIGQEDRREQHHHEEKDWTAHGGNTFLRVGHKLATDASALSSL
jgi:hypothetical protein